MDIIQSAEILKTGLLLNYFKRDNIIKLADKLIMEGVMNDDIIELSLASSIGDMVTCLNKIAESCLQKSIVKDYFFGFYNFCLNESLDLWKEVQNEYIRFIENEFVNFSDEEILFYSRLKNDVSLQKDGFSGIMDLPLEILSFFKSYNKFLDEHDRLFKGENIFPDLNDRNYLPI